MPRPPAAAAGPADGAGVAGEDRSIALAFVNSLRNGPSGTIDTIDDPVGLDRWLAEHGLAAQPGATYQDVTDAAHLRDALRGVLSACVGAVKPGAADVAAVNAVAIASPGAPQLEVANSRVRLDWVPTRGGVAEALAAVARDAITLVTSESGSRLHECAAGDCVRLFLPDRTTRTWCSTTCGNRVRAARHYARAIGSS